MKTSASSLRDRVSAFGDPSALRPVLVGLVTGLQDDPPEFQILGPALTLVVLCQATGLDPHGVVSMIQRAQSHIDGPFANQWAAMDAYAKGELLS